MNNTNESLSKQTELTSFTERLQESNFKNGKKKKQRRRKRRPSRISGKQNPLAICFSSHSSKEEPKGIIQPRKKKSRSSRLRGPVLRPVGAQVPRAPNNSTQFIMDDHENSSLFVHFNNNRDEMLKDKEVKGESDGSSPFQPSDWLPYNVADFEFAYQSAREDQMMNASIGELRKAIFGLEAKIAVVSELLEASPSRILARLQAQLLKLQEENTLLKQRRHFLEHYEGSSSSSSSSSSSTSSSSSSSSSSSCSDSESSQSSSSGCVDPECTTCAQERKAKEDEEKENTRPQVATGERTSTQETNNLTPNSVVA